MGNMCAKDQLQTDSNNKPKHSQKIINIQSTEIQECRVNLDTGDIIAMDTQAILNMTDQYISFSHPLAKSLQVRGGQNMVRECEKFIQTNGKLELSKGMWTHSGNNLTAEYIIHVNFPTFAMGLQGERELFYRAVIQSLRIADQVLQVRSISLPALPPGSFGFQKGMGAALIFKAIEFYILNYQRDLNLQTISVVAQDSASKQIYSSCYKMIIAAHSCPDRGSHQYRNSTRYDENIKGALDNESVISDKEVQEWVFQSQSYKPDEFDDQDGQTLENIFPGFGHQCNDHGFNLSVGSESDYKVQVQESKQYQNLVNSQF